MKKKKPPRTVPDRDDFYMGQAFIVASKSKDPSTQVGAVIVAVDNEPLGTGYNGPPQLIRDTDIDWDRPFKYPFIKHAESNAIDWTADRRLLKGATLYVTAAPCKACALDIVAAKIGRVVYYRPKNVDSKSLLANAEEWADTLKIMKLAKVTFTEYKGDLNWLRERIRVMESAGVFDI